MTNRIFKHVNCGRTLLAGALALGLLNPALHAQAPEQRGSAKFEAASIKPAEPGGRGMQIMMAPGGRVTMKNVNTRSLITQAYQIRDFQITGGPSWLATERFDLTAKGEDEDITPEQLRTMLQNLLADRFKLELHRETKESPVYNLVVGKSGPKLKETPDSVMPPPPPSGPGGPLPGGRGMIRMGRGSIDGQGMGMDMLSVQLSNQLGRPVINKTGLTGSYDVKLEWTPDTGQGGAFGGGAGGADAPPPADSSGPTLFTALQEQLGLKLESSKGPMTILVIDKAEKPSEN